MLDDSVEVDKYRQTLAAGRDGSAIFEVRYRHAITEEDDFEMAPGFNNFDAIRAGETLATDKYGDVKAVESGLILMPLYQRLGEDGFFIGRRVHPFWLWLSALLRGMGIQRMIHLLPGVSEHPDDPETLIVNTSVARLFPLQVFHLLGFRRRRWNKNRLIVSRRKHDTKSPFKTRFMLNR
jgi:succinylglutamate desuccinylase